MDIGAKIKRRRVMYGLTQEELADRAELSKGYISQIENDLTSPSIATLVLLLQCLGTNVSDFFSDNSEDKVVFGAKDYCKKDYNELGVSMTWLVTCAQKKLMEPVLFTIKPGCETDVHPPHEGEEFAYMLEGEIELSIGDEIFKVGSDESFYFNPGKAHKVINTGSIDAKLLWIAHPPSF